MSEPLPALAITGSTGVLGGALAAGLAQAGIPQRLLVRTPAKAPQLPGARVVRAAYQDTAETRAALAGAVYAPVGLATHYHTIQVSPYWAPSLNRLTTIGAHIFYSWRGSAGRPAAFSDRYIGNEPIAAPHARSVIDPSAALDPLALEKAYESGLQRSTSAMPSATPGLTGAPPVQPRPDYTPAVEARGGEALYDGSRLPGSGTVKSEYARSGEWIAKP